MIELSNDPELNRLNGRRSQAFGAVAQKVQELSILLDNATRAVWHTDIDAILDDVYTLFDDIEIDLDNIE